MGARTALPTHVSGPAPASPGNGHQLTNRPLRAPSANAILHTASGLESGSFHLAVAVSAQVVAVSVTDDGGTGTAPKIEHQDQDAEHGRGLGMVSAIAHRIVIHDSNGGRTVTAELFTHTRRGGHPC